MTNPVIVQLSEAKDHLNVDFASQDTYIGGLILAATSRVLAYLDTAVEAYQDSSGEWILDTSGYPELLPPEVKQAILLYIGDLYKNREPVATDPVPSNFGYGYMPRAVVALLFPIRRLVLK